MFCKGCGKEIPDDSRFCMHCGCPLAEGARARAREEETPEGGLPSSINEIILWWFGPTQKKGLFRELYRGFAFFVVLADDSGRETAWGGKLKVRFEPGRYSSPVWEKTYNVTRQDFAVETFQSAMCSDFKHLGFGGRISEPYACDGYTAKIKVWFSPDGGKKLYLEQERYASWT